MPAIDTTPAQGSMALAHGGSGESPTAANPQHVPGVPRGRTAAGRWLISILWFPVLFAIALPVVFELAFHAAQPHQVPIAASGQGQAPVWPRNCEP